MKVLFFFAISGVVISACGDTQSGSQIIGTNDALAQEACAEVEHPTETVQSVPNKDDAIEHALVHVGKPVTIELGGPTSYVALGVPHHHTDYSIFTQPAGVLKGTSTTTLSDEALNGACTDAGMGDNRLHIHEFDHSVLTLEGSGNVWLYFAQDGGEGHGGAGGAGGAHHHGEGGAGGDGHHGEGGAGGTGHRDG